MKSTSPGADPEVVWIPAETPIEEAVRMQCRWFLKNGMLKSMFSRKGSDEHHQQNQNKIRNDHRRSRIILCDSRHEKSDSSANAARGRPEMITVDDATRK